MQAVFDAVMPVFGLIWLGYLFKRIQMPGDGFWPLAERITYFIFLPSLFFVSILKADFSALASIDRLLGAVVLASVLTSAVTFAVHYAWLKLDGKRFASLYQGSIRFNNYIGIPIILSLYGDSGLVVYAIIIGLSIPLSNVLTVTVMSHYASEHPFSIRRLLCSLLTNPLILGALAGVIVNLLHIPLFYLHDIIYSFSKAGAVIGLLAVGAGLDFAAITSSAKNLTVACILKLLVNPAAMVLACLLFGVTGLERDVALVYAALPVAASSYILAKQFNAHTALMISIIITTTLVSMATLPFVLSLIQFFS